MQITYTLFLTISGHDYWAILSHCVTRIQELTHYRVKLVIRKSDLFTLTAWQALSVNPTAQCCRPDFFEYFKMEDRNVVGTQY